MPDLLGPTGEPLNGNYKELTEAVLAASIIERPTQVGASPPPRTALDGSLLWFVAQAADEFEPWGRRTKLRDLQLRAFIPTESLFASALGVVIARNQGFSWKLEGGARTAARMQRILEEANGGKGWLDFIGKFSMDLYSQDNGAFIEWVREGDRPDSPLVAINTLDSARSFHTGDPMRPVVYQDRLGAYHVLNWWEVSTFGDMPTAIEGLWGLQISALSRLLLAAQIIKNVAIYQNEKAGGRHARAIHLVKGFTTDALQEALQDMQIKADARGLMRYANPVMVGSHDPKADVGHDTIELASLPDNFDANDAFDIYVNQIAMAFQGDRQDFAPLSSGNIGTGSQSLVLHQKTRGKGPAIFMKMLTHAMNSKGLPDNVEFAFDEQDVEAEKVNAEISLARGQERAVRIQSGELTVPEARQLAVDSGDLPRELFEAMPQEDMTPEDTLRDEEQPDDTTGNIQVEGQKALDYLLRDVAASEKQQIGEVLQSRIHRAFTVSADDLYGLGYMNTDERILLSKIIGDVLDKFVEETEEHAALIISRNVAEADLRTLMAVAAKAAAEEREGSGVRLRRIPFWRSRRAAQSWG